MSLPFEHQGQHEPYVWQEQPMQQQAEEEALGYGVNPGASPEEAARFSYHEQTRFGLIRNRLNKLIGRSGISSELDVD